MLKITSVQNPRIKEVIRLRERRERDATGLFLIEGYRELKRALDVQRKIEILFICPEFFLGGNEGELIDRAEGQIALCSKEVFAKISYRDRPDGLLAIAPQLHLPFSDLEILLAKKEKPFLLIAERIEKPGNLGTILRSADGAGIDALILCDPTTDLHNPNAVRASVGTLFTVPVFEVEEKKILSLLQERHIALVAATPHAKREFTEADFTVPLAIAVGTEQYGLTENWIKRADVAVRIPMFGAADSLNVASATTLLLYEVVRQRRSAFLR